MKLYSVPEAAKVLGLRYGRLYHHLTTKYREPAIAYGRTRLLSEVDIINIRNHFFGRGAGEATESSQPTTMTSMN